VLNCPRLQYGPAHPGHLRSKHGCFEQCRTLYRGTEGSAHLIATQRVPGCLTAGIPFLASARRSLCTPSAISCRQDPRKEGRLFI
jgi:hypothetical protein